MNNLEEKGKYLKSKTQNSNSLKGKDQQQKYQYEKEVSRNFVNFTIYLSL